MPTEHPRTLNDTALIQIGQRRASAHREISRICSGERRWTMSIPVREDDSDMLFGDVLTDNETLTKEVYRLRGALRQLYTEHWGELSNDVKSAIEATLYGTADTVAPDDMEIAQTGVLPEGS